MPDQPPTTKGLTYPRLGKQIVALITRGAGITTPGSGVRGSEINEWLSDVLGVLTLIETSVPSLLGRFRRLKFHRQIPEELEGEASDCAYRDEGDRLIDFNYDALQEATRILSIARQKVDLILAERTDPSGHNARKIARSAGNPPDAKRVDQLKMVHEPVESSSMTAGIMGQASIAEEPSPAASEPPDLTSSRPTAPPLSQPELSSKGSPYKTTMPITIINGSVRWVNPEGVDPEKSIWTPEDAKRISACVFDGRAAVRSELEGIFSGKEWPALAALVEPFRRYAVAVFDVYASAYSHVARTLAAYQEALDQLLLPMVLRDLFGREWDRSPGEKVVRMLWQDGPDGKPEGREVTVVAGDDPDPTCIFFELLSNAIEHRRRFSEPLPPPAPGEPPGINLTNLEWWQYIGLSERHSLATAIKPYLEDRVAHWRFIYSPTAPSDSDNTRDEARSDVPQQPEHPDSGAVRPQASMAARAPSSSGASAMDSPTRVKFEAGLALAEVTLAQDLKDLGPSLEIAQKYVTSATLTLARCILTPHCAEPYEAIRRAYDFAESFAAETMKTAWVWLCVFGEMNTSGKLEKYKRAGRTEDAPKGMSESELREWHGCLSGVAQEALDEFVPEFWKERLKYFSDIAAGGSPAESGTPTATEDHQDPGASVQEPSDSRVDSNVPKQGDTKQRVSKARIRESRRFRKELDCEEIPQAPSNLLGPGDVSAEVAVPAGGESIGNGPMSEYPVNGLRLTVLRQNLEQYQQGGYAPPNAILELRSSCTSVAWCAIQEAIDKGESLATLEAVMIRALEQIAPIATLAEAILPGSDVLESVKRELRGRFVPYTALNRERDEAPRDSSATFSPYTDHKAWLIAKTAEINCKVPNAMYLLICRDWQSSIGELFQTMARIVGSGNRQQLLPPADAEIEQAGRAAGWWGPGWPLRKFVVDTFDTLARHLLGLIPSQMDTESYGKFLGLQVKGDPDRPRASLEAELQTRLVLSARLMYWKTEAMKRARELACESVPLNPTESRSELTADSTSTDRCAGVEDDESWKAATAGNERLHTNMNCLVSTRRLEAHSDCKEVGQTDIANQIDVNPPHQPEDSDIGATLDSRSRTPAQAPPRRTPDLDTSRDRLALVDTLARELATIKQDLKRFCTAEDLKQKHPQFVLWEHIEKAELKELADGVAFTPKSYAENLTLRKFGITSRETLKKDRKKLRHAQKPKRS